MTDSVPTIDRRTAQLLVFLSILWGGSFFFTGAVVRELPPLTIVLVRVGLGAAFFEELNIEKGRIVENNFHTYRPMRMAEFPHVHTVIAPTYDFWGGVGEPTICVAAPAVINAVFAATGKPVRTLPMKNLKLV